MADAASKATLYIVLRQTADGRWAEYAKVEATSKPAAVKAAAVKTPPVGVESAAFRDVYVAIPARSWEPVGQSPIDSRLIQQLCLEVEQAVKTAHPDATYVEHEIREVVAA